MVYLYLLSLLTLVAYIGYAFIEACQGGIYGNGNTSDTIEVGDVSVLDSLIVSGSECKIDVEDYLRE